ncbi:MAG: class I adenylate-forming enzyme family protein [Rhizomicrobium sp.]
MRDGDGTSLPGFPQATADKYRATGWWGDQTLAQRIDELTRRAPLQPAFIVGDRRTTWREYAELSHRIAQSLLRLDLPKGARIAVLLPDGAELHAAFVGCERAGLVAVGIGARAGEAEIAHILKRTQAGTLLTTQRLGLRETATIIEMLAAHGAKPRVVRLEECLAHPASGMAERPLGPDELFLINSTSGTTGLPKCVMHTQNRWFYFHKLAAAAAGFRDDEIFMPIVPGPFGFGLWTAHFSPAALGCPSVLMARFDADAALDLIARERVTVLCCVSTQFIMLLNAQAERPRDLSSLRAMFTGGEAVPFERAAEFERVTGAAVLQFYGSNETGALSRTTAADTRDRRLRTAGRIIPEMDVRLFDPDTLADITETSRIGQPGCRGPATCIGYWDDAEANRKLFTESGHMLMGDIVEIDEEGYLRVVGRTSDFIIRGGKNISAPAVEAEVATHPDIAMVAAVPAPDPVLGERVCIYALVRPGRTVDLQSITAHLALRGVSKEWFPEHLVVLDDLPRSSGGKIAKAELREDARKRWSGER